MHLTASDLYAYTLILKGVEAGVWFLYSRRKPPAGNYAKATTRKAINDVIRERIAAARALRKMLKLWQS